MSTNWPPLDMHAHIEASVDPADLLALRAVIFAASRNLAESRTALDRQGNDLLTVWGVGTHPALKEAVETFDQSIFESLVDRTAFVAEVGLDAKVKSRLPPQQDVLSQILTVLQRKPRLTSLHSYAATHEVVELLGQHPIRGAILHWWLGDHTTTIRAIELGAYFSVNPGNLKHIEVLSLVPIGRLLPETDHPAGNRFGAQPRLPGNVSHVEEVLAKRHGISTAALRQHFWSNLKQLTSATGVFDHLPDRVASIVEAAP